MIFLSWQIQKRHTKEFWWMHSPSCGTGHRATPNPKAKSDTRPQQSQLPCFQSPRPKMYLQSEILRSLPHSERWSEKKIIPLVQPIFDPFFDSILINLFGNVARRSDCFFNHHGIITFIQRITYLILVCDVHLNPFRTSKNHSLRLLKVKKARCNMSKPSYCEWCIIGVFSLWSYHRIITLAVTW